MCILIVSLIVAENEITWSVNLQQVMNISQIKDEMSLRNRNMQIFVSCLT